MKCKEKKTLKLIFLKLSKSTIESKKERLRNGLNKSRGRRALRRNERRGSNMRKLSLISMNRLTISSGLPIDTLNPRSRCSIILLI